MKTWLMAAVFGGAIGVSGQALAADPPVGHPDAKPPDLLDEEPSQLYPPRLVEWLARIVTKTDWSTGPHVSYGLAMDLSRPWDSRQRWRSGLYNELLGGFWGDGLRGSFIHGFGIVQRSSFYMDDLFDAYVVQRGGGILGLDVRTKDIDWGLRAGVGFGLRAGRFAFFEATYDRVFVFGDPFERNDFGNTSRHTSGVTVGGGIDLCVLTGCDPVKREPLPEDLTVRFYDQARAVCRNKEQKKELCAAVELAMDARKYHPLGDDDGIHAFLCGIKREVTDPHLVERMTALIRKHDDLCAQRDDDRAWARWASQHDRQLRRPLSYAPVAVEIRRKLGCQPPR